MQVPAFPHHDPAHTASTASAAGDPKAYYEPVVPSSWKPDESDEFLGLYRK